MRTPVLLLRVRYSIQILLIRIVHCNIVRCSIPHCISKYKEEKWHSDTNQAERQKFFVRKESALLGDSSMTIFFTLRTVQAFERTRACGSQNMRTEHHLTGCLAADNHMRREKREERHPALEPHILTTTPSTPPPKVGGKKIRSTDPAYAQQQQQQQQRCCTKALPHPPPASKHVSVLKNQ